MSEQYVSRFPPCPVYDMEGFESWLESMAQQGYLLEKDPFFAGFASFRKEQPRTIRYRLQPKPKQSSIFSRKDPQQDAIDLAKEYGWTYLGEHGDFFIFSAEDPSLPELDTDPRVQALALIGLEKRKKREFISNLCLLLLYLGLMIWDGPVRWLLEQNLWYGAIMALVWVVYGIFCLREFRLLHALQEQLLLGGGLTRRKDWRKRRWAHWGSALFSILLVIAFFIAAFGSRFYDWEDRLWQPRSEPLPFAEAADLYPGSTFIPDEVWIIEEVDHVAARSTWLAERQIKLSQRGQVGQQDLYLRVEYFELRTEWLAEELYREAMRAARRSKYYEARPVSDLPTAQEHAYQDVVSTCLLLQEENQVLLVELSQYDEPYLPLDQWATVFAESITE